MLHKFIISSLLIFFTRFMFSCIDCPSIEPRGFNINYISSEKIIHPEATNNPDTKKLIAFKVILNDSSKTFVNLSNTGSFFGNAYACKPLFRYKLLNNIIDIKIISKIDFDEKIIAGSDVSNLFVCDTGYSLNNNNLKFKIKDQLAIFKSDDIYTDKQLGINFFLTEDYKSSKNEFEVQVSLANGNILKVNTPIFIK
jgi:hypothetical protein